MIFRVYVSVASVRYHYKFASRRYTKVIYLFLRGCRCLNDMRQSARYDFRGYAPITCRTLRFRDVGALHRLNGANLRTITSEHHQTHFMAGFAPPQVGLISFRLSWYTAITSTSIGSLAITIPDGICKAAFHALLNADGSASLSRDSNRGIAFFTIVRE